MAAMKSKAEATKNKGENSSHKVPDKESVVKGLTEVSKTVESLPGIKQGHELIKEFLQFLSSKSVLPVAIGLIMADIVKQLVTVLVDGLIRPFIALFLPSNSDFGSFNFVIKGQVFRLGDLISVLIQAFIIFAVLYLLFAKLLKKRELLEGKKK